MAILAAADSALAAHLRAIGAGECFFAYRMLVRLLVRACNAAQCAGINTGRPHGRDACLRWCAGCLAAKGDDAGGGQRPAAMHLHASQPHLASIRCTCTAMCVHRGQRQPHFTHVCGSLTFMRLDTDAKSASAQAMQLWEALWADACWQRLVPSRAEVRSRLQSPAPLPWHVCNS